jgi:hypothetical protein
MPAFAGMTEFVGASMGQIPQGAKVFGAPFFKKALLSLESL